MDNTTMVSKTLLAYSEMAQAMFSWLDYTLFATMLGLSALIGIYYGFFSKQNTANEYLLGGKTMKVFPIAMSLVASHVSGISLLSVPADIYVYGANYWWICIAVTNSMFCTYYVFGPVFLKLQLTSTYQYLKIRFDNRVRIFAALLYTIAVMLFNPIVIYTPALAFSQATGMNLYIITPIVCIICIFYTTIGGLKGVVWSDTLQTMAIAGSMSVVFFLGVTSAGGLSNIWEKGLEGQRLDIDFDIDPTKRDTFWALVIGASINWITIFSINQGTMQRLLAVPSMSHVKRVLIVTWMGVIIVKTASTITGLIMFAKYSDCDPLTTKRITQNDQLLPFYVMDVAGQIPGLPGIFIAGVFCAGLSTLSTTLNTLSCTIYEDFLSPFMPADITQKRTSNILKLIVVIVGIISTALVFVVERLGGMLPLVVSFGGITGGPLLGIFSLGMLFPMANSKGALFGGIGGLIFTSWMVIGNQVYKRAGLLIDPRKPVSVDGCNFPININLTTSRIVTEEAFVLYRVSFWYYTLIGTTVVITIGLIVSWITGKNDPPVNPDLISPVAQFLLPKKKLKDHFPSDYLKLEKALHLVTINNENEKEINA